MWRAFRKTLKKADIFGYPAYFNYDSKAAYSGVPTHNTLLGGLLSIIALVVMLLMFLNVMQND
jgi:hypothetical protein